MKRTVLISVAVLAAVPATALARSNVRRAGVAERAGLAVPQSDPATGSKPRSQLADFACHKALDPTERSVFVRAVMRPVTGTQRMQMRFELVSRSSVTGVQSLPGYGLDTWRSPPDPTLGQRPGDRWIVPFSVANLPAPARYHYQVSFRWIGPRGHVIATHMRSSTGCFQPELRADLLVSSIAVQPIAGKPDKDQYVAAIENRGRTAAGLFAVTFAPGGGTVTMTKTVQRLGAGETRDVTFVGPACSSSTAPTIVVDPNETVDEYDYANNSLTALPVCPPLTVAPVVVG
jgi:hypothetical protein